MDLFPVGGHSTAMFGLSLAGGGWDSCYRAFAMGNGSIPCVRCDVGVVFAQVGAPEPLIRSRWASPPHGRSCDDLGRLASATCRIYAAVK